ncbi:MAG: Holliday junction DNA helicase RuvA [Candidatus Buchananbacteria bacterium RIFCSPHIGHO2_01_FULL_46_12]|uniref:Holliday junction branch migration complex subunit RuvA n=1 Tax=Candidatus Buchananbacteria bacterium RIFCSPHIGHO2_01_FULL_46_12 TaxID=1797536 RepID=A0A1G1Y2N2_9BACT|nr:MAG: Holliday junction DNA helicase RuvA [Candidatus Buchananbacteria bacterium RIFCSPHIGHO2_01_FULL_46_12]
MIASLTGLIAYKSPELRKDSYFVIDVAGVGYKVYTPAGNLRRVKEGDKITAYTYLSVSENALDLYGFLNPADKTFFTLLLDVPGIGPKSALAILEKTTMAEVQQAILAGNPEILTKMSGLGQKTAEKIIVALKDKVESLTIRTKGAKEPGLATADNDAFDALAGFGYSSSEIRGALNQLESNVKDPGEKIKAALKILGRQVKKK